MAEHSNGYHDSQETRCRVAALRAAFVADTEVARGRAQWRKPELKPRLGGAQNSAAEGLDAAIPACVAAECNRVLGQELSGGGEQVHDDLALEAKVKELDAWRQRKASEPFNGRDISKAVVSTRWVLTWKMADGRKCVEARPAAKAYRGPDLKDGNVDTSG